MLEHLKALIMQNIHGRNDSGARLSTKNLIFLLNLNI